MYGAMIKAKLDEAEAINNKAIAENRPMTEEEVSRVNALLTEVGNLEQSAEAAKKLNDQQTKMNTPVNKPVHVEVVNSNEKFNNFGEQLRAVAEAARPGGSFDNRLMVKNAASGMNESVPSDGGFLVQQDFIATLLQETYKTGKLASKCNKLPLSTNANGTKINGVDETSRATGSRFGGVQAFWEGEADQFTGSKPKFRQIELNLRKLTGLCYATDEMLQDSQQLEAFITKTFSSEFGWLIDDALINGNGVGKPLGILQSGSLVTIAKENGQAAKTILAENIIKMYARCASEMAEWYINKDTIPQLFTMSLAVGTGGAPIFMPAGGLSGKPYNTLLGLPVNPMEQCKTLGTKGDIILADFGDYMFIDKGGINTAISIHVRFIYDESCFRFTYRADGQPVRSTPLTPANGSDTTSSFVALDTRA